MSQFNERLILCFAFVIILIITLSLIAKDSGNQFLVLRKVQDENYTFCLEKSTAENCKYLLGLS